MIRKTGLLVLACMVMIVSCKNTSGIKERDMASAENTMKPAGGEFMLKIEDADLVQDESHPESNTAEWSFSVDRAGRYEVWLSSITCDTMHLGFDTAVTITAGDARLYKMPVGDNIIADSNIPSPWYRADSQMGTVFFGKPGDYLVQVISEKVVSPRNDSTSKPGATLIKSLILKPVVY